MKKSISVILSMLAVAIVLPSKSYACGGDAYLGQVCAVGFNFAPRGTAFTNGQLLPIAQNSALFSLLGAMYGGDGRTTFALPDTRGRSIVGAGQGPGLSNIRVGEKGGTESVTLSLANMPNHKHDVAVSVDTSHDTSASSAVLRALADRSMSTDPTGAVISESARRSEQFSDAVPNVDMSPDSILLNVDVVSTNEVTVAEQAKGANQSFGIRAPYIGMQYVITLVGLYPSRS